MVIISGPPKTMHDRKGLKSPSVRDAGFAFKIKGLVLLCIHGKPGKLTYTTTKTTPLTTQQIENYCTRPNRFHLPQRLLAPAVIEVDSLVWPFAYHTDWQEISLEKAAAQLGLSPNKLRNYVRSKTRKKFY